MILDKLPPSTRSLINSNRERHTLSTSGKNTKSSRRTRHTQISRYLQESSDNFLRTETNKQEKIILNTWVEGPTEISNLIDYEKPKELYQNEKALINQRDKIRDYEEILQDSPTNTQQQIIFEDINSRNILLESLDLETESVDKLVQEINELSKKSSQIKKGLHKRGASHVTGPPRDVKIKRLVHQSSMLINTTDLESLFKKSKTIQPTTEKFDKIDPMRVNRFYSDQRKYRSSLSLSLQNYEAGRVNKFTTFLLIQTLPFFCFVFPVSFNFVVKGT